MAAPMKRPLGGDGNEDGCAPHKKQDISNDEKLQNFLDWCRENNFKLSPKVKVSRNGSCAQYGMVALEDIAEGYVLFQVPRSCLLMHQNTEISDLVETDLERLSATNQWVPLIISLIHERNNKFSKWRPYLDLVPDYDALDLPIFWSSDDIDKYLGHSGVDSSVTRDVKMMKDDFETLALPFFQRHSQIGDDVKGFEQFKQQVAFIMSYSFTEPKKSESCHEACNGNSEACNGDSGACNGDSGACNGDTEACSGDSDAHNEESDSEDSNSDDDNDDCCVEMSLPMMVPMADMLNHVTKHNAKLSFGKEAFKMVTTRQIKKGEEIFNSYGELTNLHLMHMYGFAEPYPDNDHDVVEVSADIMLEAAKDIGDPEDSEFLKTKWKYLKDQDVITEDEIFAIGREGVISDEICVESLKVLCKSKSDFDEYNGNSGWSDGESDSSLSGESKLSLEKIQGIDKKWKQLLKRTAEIHMSKYPTTLSQDEEKIKSSTTVMGSRETFSTHLVHGQKKILQAVIDACA